MHLNNRYPRKKHNLFTKVSHYPRKKHNLFTKVSHYNLHLPLYVNEKEVIMHQFWECKYAQQAWDYTKAIVCEFVNGAKPFQLASPMQWKHVLGFRGQMDFKY
jgi:hypothetical protein